MAVSGWTWIRLRISSPCVCPRAPCRQRSFLSPLLRSLANSVRHLRGAVLPKPTLPTSSAMAGVLSLHPWRASVLSDPQDVVYSMKESRELANFHQQKCEENVWK